MIALIISFLKNIASSLGRVDLAFLFLPTCYAQGHFNRCACLNVVFLYCFLVIQHFSLVSNIFAGFSLSVALDTDCLYVDCSHVHCHVEVLGAILVHTFVADLAILFNVELEDVLQELGHTSNGGHVVFISADAKMYSITSLLD